MGLTNLTELQVSGVPVFGESGRYSSPWASHYFVDGDNGSDQNNGMSGVSEPPTPPPIVSVFIVTFLYLNIYNYQ